MASENRCSTCRRFRGPITPERDHRKLELVCECAKTEFSTAGSALQKALSNWSAGGVCTGARGVHADNPRLVGEVHILAGRAEGDGSRGNRVGLVADASRVLKDVAALHSNGQDGVNQICSSGAGQGLRLAVSVAISITVSIPITVSVAIPVVSTGRHRRRQIRQRSWKLAIIRRVGNAGGINRS